VAYENFTYKDKLPRPPSLFENLTTMHESVIKETMHP